MMRVEEALGDVKVTGYGPDDAVCVLVGQSPGREEEIRGVPFIGPAGRYVQRCFEEAGLSWDRVYKTNVFLRRLYAKDVRLVMRLAERERERLQYEVDQHPDAKLVVLAGNEALFAFTGIWGVRRHVGLVHPKYVHVRVPVLSVYHPAFVLRSGGDASRWHAKLVQLLRKGFELAGV